MNSLSAQSDQLVFLFKTIHIAMYLDNRIDYYAKIKI